VQVRGAAAAARISEDTALPDRVAYVLPVREVATERVGGSFFYHQEIRVEAGVMLGARSYADATGASAAADIAGMITATREALLGWLPGEARTVVEFLSGNVQQVDEDGFVWWLERYSCSYWIEVSR
jgi:hypothetical protein